MHEIIPGLVYAPDYFSRDEQHELLADLREAVKAAPLFTPRMPRTGKEFSVRMTNCGALGWVSDRERGYRYQATHPETGKPWPKIPKILLDLWEEVTVYRLPPEA